MDLNNLLKKQPSDMLVLVFQKLLTHWDFYPQLSEENGKTFSTLRCVEYNY